MTGNHATYSKPIVIVIALWITHYQRARPMYMLGSRLAQQNADIVIDGMRPVEDIAADILNGIKEKKEVES